MVKSMNRAVQEVIEDLVTGSHRVEKSCTYRGLPASVKGYWVGNLIRVDIQGKKVEELQVN